MDESQDWPLRDWATRLRPPGGEEPSSGPPPEEREEEPPLVSEEAVAATGVPEEEEEQQEPVSEEAVSATGVPEEEEQEPAAEVIYEEEPVLAPEVEAPEVPVDEHAGGEFRVPEGHAVLEGAPTGRRRAVAIVISRFNGEITNRLLDSALDELAEAGVAQDAILIMPVPGAFELPLAAMALAKTRRYACVIALGCVIRGETPHFDYVASEAASGLQLAALETGVPVSFGVLTCDTPEQAEARVAKGAEAARTALEMADVFAQLRAAAAVRAE